MPLSFLFFFTLSAPPEIYTLSLHDALPIWAGCGCAGGFGRRPSSPGRRRWPPDRKSTRLNSSHLGISYAVFCLKKKKKKKTKTMKVVKKQENRDVGRGQEHLDNSVVEVIVE